MKKFATIICVVFFISCGGGSETKTTTTGSDSAATSATPSTDPDATKGLALISKSDCFSCHKLREASTGPAYADVAAKYKTLTPVVMDSIVKQILKGGSGRWGTIPMPQHPGVSKEDAMLMAHYVMSINK